MAGRRQLLRLGIAAAGVPALVGVPAFGGVAVDRPAANWPGLRRGPGGPLVIGHRGACGYRPEHTLASYELAVRLGADFIEPDLVSTRDGVLVARHEPEISGTTDVAMRPQFARRRRTKRVDGLPVTGWFADDFTLAELKTLRAVERLPGLRQHNTIYNNRFEIPTFQEILDLRARMSRELGREIGVYPETKHPTYFRDIDLPLEPPLVDALRRNRLDHRQAPVFVQSFEAANLRLLHEVYQLRVPKVFLTSSTGTPFSDPRSYASYLTAVGLRELSTFVTGLGPDKDQVIPRLADGTLGVPTSLVADAHAAALLVHPYTFRAEDQFLPVEDRTAADPTGYGRAIDEQLTFLRTGIDGLFTDQADIAVLARQVLAR